MAEAGILETLSEAIQKILVSSTLLITKIPLFFMALIMGLLAMVAGLIFSTIASILSWLMTVCLNVSITQNAIVLIGWAFTRDFINMFFLLILAIIGLAKILRLKNYEVEKTLPKLIAVILLINFTPVLVGFVVDIANIFTNFFFNKTGEISSLPSLLDQAVNYITSSFQSIFFFKENSEVNNLAIYMGNFASIMIYGLVLIMFYAFSAFTYFTVFIILFVRIIYLWILMILSPIAFFSQVLPTDSDLVKSLLPDVLSWKGWWKEFVAWATVGIPIGFFLYLSNLIMIKQDEVLTAFQLETTLSLPLKDTVNSMSLTQTNDLLGKILAPMISVAMLWFGIMISIQSMPKAASKLAEKSQKIAGAITKDRISEVREVVGQKMRDMGDKMRASEGTGLRGWTTRRIGGTTELAGRIIEKDSKKKELDKVLGIKPSKTVASIKSKIILDKLGNSDDLESQMTSDYAEQFEIMKIMDSIEDQKLGVAVGNLTANSSLSGQEIKTKIQNIIDGKNNAKTAIKREILSNAFAGVSNKNMETLDKKFFETDLGKELAPLLTPGQLGATLKNSDQKTRDIMQSAINSRGENLVHENPALVKYLMSSPAFLKLPPEIESIDKTKLNQHIKQVIQIRGNQTTISTITPNTIKINALKHAGLNFAELKGNTEEIQKEIAKIEKNQAIYTKGLQEINKMSKNMGELKEKMEETTTKISEARNAGASGFKVQNLENILKSTQNRLDQNEENLKLKKSNTQEIKKVVDKSLIGFTTNLVKEIGRQSSKEKKKEEKKKEE